MLIQSFESCKLKAYPDPKTGGAPWTVGWGATGGNIGPSTVWTQDQADSRFETDLEEYEEQVVRAVKKPMTQGQFDAFVSIFFNVGFGSSGRDGIGRLKNGRSSTLLAKFNDGDIAGTCVQWLLWISPGSSVTNGLLRRRKAELALFKS